MVDQQVMSVDQAMGELRAAIARRDLSGLTLPVEGHDMFREYLKRVDLHVLATGASWHGEFKVPFKVEQNQACGALHVCGVEMTTVRPDIAAKAGVDFCVDYVVKLLELNEVHGKELPSVLNWRVQGMRTDLLKHLKHERYSLLRALKLELHRLAGSLNRHLSRWEDWRSTWVGICMVACYVVLDCVAHGSPGRTKERIQFAEHAMLWLGQLTLAKGYTPESLHPGADIQQLFIAHILTTSR